MRLLWTKRGLKRLQSAFDYIADNFYLDYAIQFDTDARNVALMLPANPQLGREASRRAAPGGQRSCAADHFAAGFASGFFASLFLAAGFFASAFAAGL